MKKIVLIGVLFALMATACDDDTYYQPVTLALRDVTQVQKENDLALQTYLKTHFYNSELKDGNFGGVVGLDTIAGENADRQSLWQQVQKKTFMITDAQGEKVEHTLYYLILKEGDGSQATIADKVSVKYEGRLVDGTVFDKSERINWANRLDLLGDGSGNGTIKGFQFSVSLLKDSSASASENSDGTLTLPNGFGRGVFFMPSALGYFSTSYSKIPSYSPLIFTIDLYKTTAADHDKDGILSIDEISVDDYGVITLTDCNSDGTPDYLDAKQCK